MCSNGRPHPFIFKGIRMEVTKEKLQEIKGALELAITTAPNLPEATLSNGCIQMAIKELDKLID